MLEELITSISSFGKKWMLMWVEMKCSLGLKSDGMLVCHLLNTGMTVSNRKNSTEANDLNQSELQVFHLSVTVKF